MLLLVKCVGLGSVSPNYEGERPFKTEAGAYSHSYVGLRLKPIPIP
jgi:hypothetical protein